MAEEDYEILNGMGDQAANAFCETVGCTPYVNIGGMKPRQTQYTKSNEDQNKELPTKNSDIQPRLPKIEQEKEIKESGKEEEILNKDLLQKSSDQNCTEQNLEGDNSLKKKLETNEDLTKQNKAVLDQNTQESKPKEANQEEEPADAKLEEQREEKETNLLEEEFF